MRFSIAIAIATLMGSALVSRGEDAPQDAQGLIVTFSRPQPTAPSQMSDARIARIAAIFVPQGTSPTPFLAPGPFLATFEGDINVRLRTFVRFSAFGNGKVTVMLAGRQVFSTNGDDLSKSISDEVRLGKGKNHLVVEYESPASGDASFRLFWSSKTWQPEPVPPTAFTLEVPDDKITRSLLIRQGRFLFAQYRCAKCHAAGDLSPKEQMPELAMDAPALVDIGLRLHQQWMAQWIADPRAVRPGSHMPRLFHQNAGDKQAPNDIAAYLAYVAIPANFLNGNLQSGGRLFANLDCIACHTTPDGKSDPARISLAQVKMKFRPGSLRDYLLDPAAHYVWNPMPNFHLSQQEASDLAAYLMTAKDDPAEPAAGDVARGETLVASAGCLNCHQLGEQHTTLHAPALADLTVQSLTKGCLAAQGSEKAPDFAFSAEQRSALVAFLETNRNSLNQDAAPEFADRQISAMRCTACHSRDGNESLLGQALDAESQALHQAFPNPPVTEKDLIAAEQHPPMLTWAGEKLRPEWMSQFIAGQIPYKPRYYLRARMPSFTSRAEGLAKGLAEEHGCEPALSPNPAPDAKLAEIGRMLCSKTPNQGFSCVQCHSVADQPPFAAFESASINFKYLSARLRQDYYMRWVLNPQRIDPNTKMPRFDDDEQKTGLAAFDNDAKKQFEAIWQYLLEGEKIVPPQ